MCRSDIAAEGEPATFKDRLLVRRNPYRVIDGIQIAAHATGAEKAYVGLKEAFSKEFDALSRALEEMERADALPVGVELVAGPDHYLLGEETGLLEVSRRCCSAGSSTWSRAPSARRAS